MNFSGSTDQYFVCDSWGTPMNGVRYDYVRNSAPTVGYQKPIRMVICSHCKSKMTNELSNCSQCGAPLPLYQEERDEPQHSEGILAKYHDEPDHPWWMFWKNVKG